MHPRRLNHIHVWTPKAYSKGVGTVTHDQYTLYMYPINQPSLPTQSTLPTHPINPTHQPAPSPPSPPTSRKISDVRVHARVRQYGRSLSGRREHLEEDVITYCCTGGSGLLSCLLVVPPCRVSLLSCFTFRVVLFAWFCCV